MNKRILFFIILIMFNVLVLFSSKSFASSYNGIPLSEEIKASSSTSFKSGDINNDGSINLIDVLALRRFIAKPTKWSLTSSEQKKADVNGDSNLNLTDVLKLRRYIAATSNNSIANNHPDWLNLYQSTIDADGKFEISTNNIDNGNVILAGNKFEFYINILTDDYNIDTSKIKILNPDEISLSGAVVNSSDSIEKGGATTSNFNVTVSGKRITISAQTHDGINMVGYIVVELEQGFLTSGSYSNQQKRYTYYVASLNASTKLNNNKVALTTTVGVHNSFYIKNYYYGDVDTNYTQNISDTGKTASTTNEYTYTNLTNNSHKITVEIVFYIDKNNTTYEKRGMISKNVEVSTNNNEVEIHYIDLHNAGSEENHGTQDSIFLKIPYENSYKTMLIDMGKDESADAIDKYLRIDNHLVTPEKTSDNNYDCVKIDYLILTHPHSDHYGGFSNLTGISYNENSEYKYTQNRNNKLNNQQMFYYFRNIIVGCNFQDMISNKQILTAIYNYASHTEKLTTVTAGNVLQIGNVTFNIFNPYPAETLPLEWLGDYYRGNKYFRNQTWICKEGKSLRKDSNGNEIFNPNGIGTDRLSQNQENNSSIVTKVIVGNGKTLLTGDSTFYAEEMLTGRYPLELNGDEGLAIHDKDGNATCINLIEDLKSKYNMNETQLENTYHLSRFTKKDLSAAVLKKGHHNAWNSSSLKFLRIVNPSKIVVTNAVENDSTLRDCVDSGPITYRFTWYYNNLQNVELTDSNFSQYIYGTSNHKVISRSNGSVSR